MLIYNTHFDRYLRWLLCFLFLQIALYKPIFAQQEKIDSLQHVLDTTNIASNKVDVLLELSFYIRNTKPNITLSYAEEALILSKEIKYAKGQAQAIRNIGLGYMKLGQYDTAIYLCEKAIEIADSLSVLESKADALNTLGNIYFHQAAYDEALDAFKKTAEIYDKLGKLTDKGGAYSNVGLILETKGDLNRGLEYYNKALLIFETHNHLDGIATVSNNMAGIFQDEGDIEKALKYYKRTAYIDSTTNNIAGFANTISNIAGIKLSLEDTIGSINDYRKAINLFSDADANCRVSSTLSNLGDIYLKLNILDSAYAYISNAVNTATKCNDLNDLIFASIDFGRYYKQIGDDNKAIFYFDKSFTIASDEGNKHIISEAAEQLYLMHKKLNNTKLALKFLEIHTQLESELFNNENSRKIAQLEAAYDLEKEKQAFEHESKINQIKFENEIADQKVLQNAILIILIIFIILLVFICWLYFFKSRINKKLNIRNKEVLAQNEQITKQQNQLQEHSKIVESQKQDLLKANKELKALNEEKNTLIGIVAHDLKSPINQIKGLIMLSKIEIKDKNVPNNLIQNLELMESSSQKSIDMINRILDINAIENKSFELHLEQIDSKKLFQEIEETFQLQAQAKNINLLIDVEDIPKNIKVDKNLLSEILENLVSNAIKFSPRYTEIKLGIKDENNRLKFYVQDQGPGINEDDKKMMFNKYQRLSATPTANETSTGLGLSIVKRLTEELGGKVYCESDGGNGATFIVEFNK